MYVKVLATAVVLFLNYVFCVTEQRFVGIPLVDEAQTQTESRNFQKFMEQTARDGQNLLHILENPYIAGSLVNRNGKQDYSQIQATREDYQNYLTRKGELGIKSASNLAQNYASNPFLSHLNHGVEKTVPQTNNNRLVNGANANGPTSLYSHNPFLTTNPKYVVKPRPAPQHISTTAQQTINTPSAVNFNNFNPSLLDQNTPEPFTNKPVVPKQKYVIVADSFVQENKSIIISNSNDFPSTSTQPSTRRTPVKHQHVFVPPQGSQFQDENNKAPIKPTPSRGRLPIDIRKLMNPEVYLSHVNPGVRSPAVPPTRQRQRLPSRSRDRNPTVSNIRKPQEPQLRQNIQPTLEIVPNYVSRPKSGEYSQVAHSTRGRDKNTANSPAAQLQEELFKQQAESANYSFSSEIDDSISGNQIGREEVREGGTVKGRYTYSDGYFKRTVVYEADDKGYRVVKEDVEPLGDGPKLDPNGRADVSSYVAGNTVNYSITRDDIQENQK